MKRFFIMMAVAAFAWGMLPGALSASAQQTDEGYVFVTKLQSHSRRTLKSRVKSTIKPAHVAVDAGDNQLLFHCVDAMEYIEVGNGTFYKYFPPAQDYVEAEYISVAQFKKATRKVSISREAPAGWEQGKKYTFKTSDPDSYVKSVTVRTVRIVGDIVLATGCSEDFELKDFVNISGATLTEIVLESESPTTIYWYNGQQVISAGNIGGNEYRTLVIDNGGNVFSKDDESGTMRRESRLSNVFGEYPSIEYFGWISPTEIVVDDQLFVAE